MSLTWADFAGRDGQSFRLEANQETFAIVLETATEIPGAPREGGAFRLAFRGPVEPVLKQAIYRIMGEAIDAEIFLVPVSQNQLGTVYEAIFN